MLAKQPKVNFPFQLMESNKKCWTLILRGGFLKQRCWKKPKGFKQRCKVIWVNEICLCSAVKSWLSSQYATIWKCQGIKRVLTWDQALFSFRFENNIPAGKTKRKESLIQTFDEMSATHFFWLIDICRISQSELLPLLVFLVCKFFTRGKNADWLT